MTKTWVWTGAKSVGSSHIATGTECQDFACCIEIPMAYGNVLLSVVSDGAGSAFMSKVGAQIVCRSIQHSAKMFLSLGYRVGHINSDEVDRWIDDIRDRIGAAADRSGCNPKDFAATLVCALVAPTEAAIIHVGDGACVIRCEYDERWTVPSWPLQGQYASTTAFVTDDPSPIITLTAIDERISEVAIFTDGLEKLALDFSSRIAFDPFFESVFGPVRKSSRSGRDRQLSRHLKNMLDSPRITDRTDDDKTLILARRVS